LEKRKNPNKQSKRLSNTVFGEMAEWSTSTHRRKWQPMREELNQWKQNSLNQPLLSPVEESALLANYGRKLLQISDALQLPDRATCTACTLLRRLASTAPMSALRPKHMAQQAIYLASKAEDCPVASERMASVTGDDPASVLKREGSALDWLQYDLAVFFPIRSLDGILADADSYCSIGDGLGDRVPGLRSKTRAIILDSLALTDAPLLLSPGQIAAASLCNAGSQLDAGDFVRERVHAVTSNAGLHAMLDSAEALLDEHLHDARSNELSHEELEDVVERIKRGAHKS
jgi:hypothetical protein